MSFIIIVVRIALLIASVGVNGLLLSFLRDPFEELIDDIKIDYLYALSDFGEILVVIGGMVLVTAFMAYLIFG